MRCLRCETTHMVEKVLTFEEEINGKQISVQTEALQCPVCDCTVMTLKQKSKQMKLIKAELERMTPNDSTRTANEASRY